MVRAYGADDGARLRRGRCLLHSFSGENLSRAPAARTTMRAYGAD